jgi:hypothetical protein
LRLILTEFQILLQAVPTEELESDAYQKAPLFGLRSALFSTDDGYSHHSEDCGISICPGIRW